jgi:2-polyprenyl-3-methyl-5-hydroxy-6-metoxy-1,4-benzoquinol methylase
MSGMQKNNSLKTKLKASFPALHKALSKARQRSKWYFAWRKAGAKKMLEFRKVLASAGKDASQFKHLPRTNDNAKAVRYVGTEVKEGISQLAILIYEKCKPSHKVLEIGCGALSAGYPIMQYLDKGNYYGIDPNQWLLDDIMESPEVLQTVKDKDAHFAYNAEFDASEFGVKFDYIISHSILSHAAHWQWPLFLTNVDKCVKKGTKILFSLYFNEGNINGARKYAGTELDFEEWVYPAASFFRKSTIVDLAESHGYKVTIDLIPPMLITYANPSSKHTWITLEKL